MPSPHLHTGADLARTHARDLLHRLGVVADPAPRSHAPALAWRRAGLMEITGRPDGPGLVAPVALTAAADGALAALGALTPDDTLPANGALLLGERARLLGLRRRGDVSANGSCRLIAMRDGHIALNLPRSDDWALTEALLGAPATDWTQVAGLASGLSCAELVIQGRLLGLAVADVQPKHGSAAPFTIQRFAEHPPAYRTPLVVDLSALWAGPLAGALLQAVGARVVKVESLARPDGARTGDARFFDLMNGGKASVALDFSDPVGLERLRRLVAAADIVIESARPRALAALGVDAEAMARRGAVWVSITAHGRVREAANWIGFGDDAAVAGGVSAAMARAWGAPLFAGDAIADPLTGITAALAGWAAWRTGGGAIVSLALSQVVAHACALHEADAAELSLWQAAAEADAEPLYPLRKPAANASALGADTAAVLAQIGG